MAERDVHIQLSEKNNNNDLIEIVIGGWKDTQSVIRKRNGLVGKLVLIYKEE